MKQQNNREILHFTPEPAESFEIEFLNVKKEKAQNAMSQIGDFIMRSSGPESDGVVYFSGEREDGTKIKIIIEKGDSYKSPAEIEREHQQEEEGNAE